jgi:hypothetical protein
MFSFEKNSFFFCAQALLAVSCAIAAVLAYVYFVRGVDNFSESIRGIESDVATKEEERRLARHSQDLLEEKKEDLAKIYRLFVNRDHPVEFIEELERLAAETKNTVSLDISDSEQASDSLFFRVSVKGSKESVVNYLRLMEAAPYLITIQEINYRTLEGKNPFGSDGLRVNLSREGFPPPTASLSFSMRVTASGLEK